MTVTGLVLARSMNSGSLRGIRLLGSSPAFFRLLIG